MNLAEMNEEPVLSRATSTLSMLSESTLTECLSHVSSIEIDDQMEENEEEFVLKNGEIQEVDEVGESLENSMTDFHMDQYRKYRYFVCDDLIFFKTV